jgi:hypothetical protein
MFAQHLYDTLWHTLSRKKSHSRHSGGACAGLNPVAEVHNHLKRLDSPSTLLRVVSPSTLLRTVSLSNGLSNRGFAGMTVRVGFGLFTRPTFKVKDKEGIKNVGPSLKIP